MSDRRNDFLECNVAMHWILGVVFCLISYSAVAVVADQNKPTALDAIRFTKTENTASDGTPEVIYEQGTFFVHSGFVPNYESRTSTGIWRVDPAFLEVINGKPLRQLSAWQNSDDPRGRLEYFQRSQDTYSVQGSPYVILGVSDKAPPLPSPELRPPRKGSLRNVTKATALSAFRFTVTGETAFDGTPEVIYEQGDLFLKSGYVPTYESRTSTGVWRIDPVYLNYISGKPMRNLSAWESDDSPRGRLVNFQRSTGYYWIQGAPAVIVAVAGSGSQSESPFASSKPVVTLSTSNASVTEGEPYAEFVLNLDKPAPIAVVVNYKISGSVRPRKDYRKVKGNVRVPKGATSVVIRVRLVDDARSEGTELISCTIKGGKGYRRNPDTGTTVTMEVIDNE